jgi:hypothetical protein
MNSIHRNTLILAPSSNPNREGRCCLNGSYQIRRKFGVESQSLNKGIDNTLSDEKYVPTRLPTLTDLCDSCQETEQELMISLQKRYFNYKIIVN